MRLVEHPNNDEALLVTRRQLLVLVVPLKDHDVALMALQVLVHGKVSATLALSRLQLENLEEALITTGRQVALLLVPCHDVQHRVVGHGDLRKIIIEVSIK